MKPFRLCLALVCLTACQTILPAPTPTPAPSATPAPTDTVAPLTATPAPPTPARATRLAPSAEPPLIRLLFTGDINPGRCPAHIALAADDFTGPYQVVGAELAAADLTIGSLDGTLSNSVPPYPCTTETMDLIGPTRTVEGLTFAGFDVLTVATNHAKDCRLGGGTCAGETLFETRAILTAAGILPAGSGANAATALTPVIVERQGIRFAFVGVDAVGPASWATRNRPGTAPLTAATLTDTLAAVTAARAQADVVIVLPHWGSEYSQVPNTDQLAWGPQLVAAGATLVIGNHPHRIQAIETLPTGVIAYSLGNFVFDQDRLMLRQSILFEAVFRGSQLADWQIRPARIYEMHQPRWPKPAEAQAILDRVATLSAALPER